MSAINQNTKYLHTGGLDDETAMLHLKNEIVKILKNDPIPQTPMSLSIHVSPKQFFCILRFVVWALKSFREICEVPRDWLLLGYEFLHASNNKSETLYTKVCRASYV